MIHKETGWSQRPRVGDLALDAITLFRGGDLSEVRDAIRYCEVHTLTAGTPLLCPGDSNETIFVLLSGLLAVYLESTRLPEATIHIHPGESVGEMSAVDGQPVSALVVALTEARVLAIPGAVFWHRLSAIPEVARNLLAMQSSRMRESNKAVLEAQREQLSLEYLRRELQTARQLQASMIPCRGRMFPERNDIEIAGLMQPAAEVGGDFFDAFFVDGQCLFFCVGDVSGHGIPAALFMARTIGLIRLAAIETREPGLLLRRINEQLCTGNDTNIFVTLFCGFLEVGSGEFAYANGGHCAPLVARDGLVSQLAVPREPLVGVFPGLQYTSRASVLDEGATLICYTDGVIEAESTEGVAFAEERLASIGMANLHRPVITLLDTVQVELATFSGRGEQADDCTLLAVRRPTKLLVSHSSKGGSTA